MKMDLADDLYTVKELIAELETMPENAPVLVSGYNSGYETFYQPFLAKVSHFPENMYFDGEYQPTENKKAMEAVILRRVNRDD